MSDLVGCRVGDYQVLRHLGDGGMADVYAARHLKLKRDVALKVLRKNETSNDSSLKRFRREAQAAARLNHPSIVQVYEINDADGKHFIAQELIEGTNLRQYLERHGVLSASEAVKLMWSVCSALQSAHSEGITHRDVKPENIMRRSDGEYKVTDFGLARMLTRVDSSTANLTRDGLTLGTPRYMSPEQIQGREADARSDLYSLGVTMYHLLSGSPPFSADEPLALAVAHLHETPEPLDHVRGETDLPAWLVSTVMRLLQKNPAVRFQSAAEVLAVLQRHAPMSIGSNDELVVPTGVSPADAASDASDPASVTIATGSAPTLGVSAATVQLQRVTDTMRAQHQRRWRRRVLIALGVIGCAGLGYAAARPLARTSIERTLRGPMVQQADSIAQQYLVAITRDDVAAWEAVETYFGDQEDAVSKDYVLKAKLQLARLLIEQKEFRRAGTLLDEIEKAGSAKSLYRLIAILYRHRIAMAENNDRYAASLKSEAQSLISELKRNPQAMQALPQIIQPQDDWIYAWL